MLCFNIYLVGIFLFLFFLGKHYLFFSPHLFIKKIFFLYITSSVSFSKVSSFLFLPFFLGGGGGGGGEGVWVSLCNIVKENILSLYTHDNSIFWDTR